MKHTNPFLLAAGVAILPTILNAAIAGPYVPDANTLHLWQFDEASGTTAASSLASGSFDLTAVNGATLGTTSFTGFGNAGSTALGSDDAFQGNFIPVSAVTGGNGAFTFEAMIRVGNITAKQEIISMENGSPNAQGRPFQFALTSGNVRFQDIGDATFDAAIPTSGPDAFAANEWFHVAVTYNGSGNTAGNLSLYWTRVDASRTEANLLVSYTLPADLGGNNAILGIGNEFRDSPGENLEGRIDEVRISDIARGADEMMFAVPEPSTFALMLGVLALGFVTWRRSVQRAA